jgi:hypothetical protein
MPKALYGKRGRIAVGGVLAFVVWLLGVAPGAAELIVPPGFSVHGYVSGEGFSPSAESGARGVPSASTLAVDDAGALYLARTGRRYTGGEVEDVWPIYRIPVGGARLTPATEASYFYGPPLPNAQVGPVRGGRELFVTTFDRDRRIGVLYRMVDGRAELFAGGTPPAGTAPLLRQPEGAAVDAASNVYVADRAQGVVVKLDPSGRVLDPRWFAIARPRLLAVGGGQHVWIGSDGDAEAPWQRGTGEISRVNLHGVASAVLRGPVAAAIGVSPTGHLFVADRQAGKIFFLDAEGNPVEFARFTDGDLPRSLCFAPVTPETRRAGIAGDLFVVTIARGAWQVNEILRVSGPFDELVRGKTR